MSRNPDLSIKLHPKQWEAFHSPAQEIYYGGAAGAGKSHLARVISIYLCCAIPGFQMFLFRRHYQDLRLSHYIGPNSFHQMLADMIAAGRCTIADMEIRFNNGSTIHGCHLQYEHDVYKYKSVEMHGRIMEEASEFTAFQLQYIGTRARYPESLPVPETLKGKLPFALYPTNPGGVGHDYLMSLFQIHDWIERIGPGNSTPVYKTHGSDRDAKGKTRQFIPARLSDNPSINREDYIASLSELRNQEMLRALLDGDMTVRLGQLLPELQPEREGKPWHVIPHFNPPRHWTRKGAHDWGASSPAATIWCAVADGEFGGLPRGALYVYREWLLANPIDSTKGLGYSNKQIAEGIAQRSDQPHIPFLTDTIPFQERGGIPMYQEYGDCGVHLVQADVSSKEVSVQAFRSLLIGEGGRPMVYFSDQCPDSVRCLQSLRPHRKNCEKPADHPEDHLPDCVFHMAREWVSVQDAPETMRERVKKQIDEGVKPEIVTIEHLGINLDFVQ